MTTHRSHAAPRRVATRRWGLSLLLAAGLLAACRPALAVPEEVERLEAARVALAGRASAPTVAVFKRDGTEGGSGVLISADGYALTNFHVVAPCGPLMLCGLADGRLLDAVLVGLDPTGDVALIQVLADGPLPYAELGDSDAVRPGDEALVVGNPFLLADDYRPTVTHGVISGVHRYQYPAGDILEYGDALQTDAAINPGNSGGPLFDAAGRVVGINGRASFEKRGRVNVGVGYAVSINQVKRFLPLLRAGLIVDHAALGATYRTAGRRRVALDAVEAGGAADRAGLRLGDEVLALAGREVTSANALQNLLATLPAGWRATVEHRRGLAPQDSVLWLGAQHPPGQLERVVEEQLAALPKESVTRTDPGATAARARYERRAGFANYAYNRRAVERLLTRRARATPAEADAPCVFEGRDPQGAPTRLSLAPDRCEYEGPAGAFWIDPTQPPEVGLAPPGSGGLLAALAAWRRMGVAGPEAFDTCWHGGELPWSDGAPHEVLHATWGPAALRFYFDPQTADLTGVELTPDLGAQACRLELTGFEGDGPERAPRRLAAWREGELWTTLEPLSIRPPAPGR